MSKKKIIFFLSITSISTISAIFYFLKIKNLKLDVYTETQMVSVSNHLLLSQQNFQKALATQSNPTLAIDYFNQAVVEASEAIASCRDEPCLVSSYYQRGWLYATRMYSYPAFIPLAISDLKKTPQNPESIKILSNLYALAPKNQPTPVLDKPTETASSPELIIASSTQNDPNQVASQTTSNAISDVITLNPGQKSFTLKNNNIKSTSQIYLTQISGDKNRIATVLSKSTGQAQLGFDQPVTIQTQIKYYIIY